MKSVLVVDDSDIHLEKLSSLVAKQGYQVLKATSGNQCIEIAKAKQPDMIFLDIVMDDLDGYGACRQLVSDDATAHIPVVFVSTKNQRADRLWAMKQGAKALIAKPWQDQEIIDALQSYLG